MNQCDFKMVRKCIILKYKKCWIWDGTVALGRSEGLADEPSQTDVAKIHNRPVHTFRVAVARVYRDCPERQRGRPPEDSAIPDASVGPINKVMRQFESVENFTQSLHEIFTGSFRSAACKYIPAIAAADERLQGPRARALGL